MRNGLSLALTKNWRKEDVPPPDLAYNFLNGNLNPTFGNKSITFTRASIGNRFNSSGLLESVAVNTPRFDYDPATGVNRGFLTENAATNRCLNNRDMTQASWVKTNCTSVKDQNGIDNVASSCSRLTAADANATCIFSVTLASGLYAVSIFAKRLSGSGILEMSIDGITWIDVTAQLLVTGPNGFSRIILTPQTIANPKLALRIQTNGDSFAFDFGQIETNLHSSPIATAGANVTRSSDIATFDPVGLYFQSGISMASSVEYHPIAMVGRLVSFEIPTDLALFNYRPRNTNPRGASIITTGGLSVSVSSSTSIIVSAGRVRTNDAYIINRTGERSVDTLGTMPPDITAAAIGSRSDGGLHIQGWIQNLMFWKTPLTNSQLAVIVK